MPSHRRLQQFAIAISIISIVYNGAEGGISIGFGSESSSRSLVFFGVQSAIEVISAIIVLWRFRKVAKPGEERNKTLGARELRIEKIASSSIGGLLLALGLGTEISAIVGLVLHQKPDASNASLIISAAALVLMILIWLPKRYLARALDSSAMQGEATCSLSCIQITLVLFFGSLIFRLWRGGWWVDSATSLILGLLFGWEGIKMIRWVRNPAFDGGCCDHDGKKAALRNGGGTAELGEQYRDLCDCCLEKSECKESGECKCAGLGDASDGYVCSCKPTLPDGSKCCTHKIVQGPRPVMRTDLCCGADTPKVDIPCSKPGNDKKAAADSCCGGASSTCAEPVNIPVTTAAKVDSCCAKVDSCCAKE